MTYETSREDWVGLLAGGRTAQYSGREYGNLTQHVIVVATPGVVCAECTCGWSGPDRTGDEHAVGLVVDDADQHCHEVMAPCTNHDLPTHACLTCEQRGFR